MGKRGAPEGGESSRPRRGSDPNFLFRRPETVPLLCPQVAKLRHQLQKRSRHAPPTPGYELPQPPPAVRHAAGVAQVAASPDEAVGAAVTGK